MSCAVFEIVYLDLPLPLPPLLCIFASLTCLVPSLQVPRVQYGTSGYQQQPRGLLLETFLKHAHPRIFADNRFPKVGRQTNRDDGSYCGSFSFLSHLGLCAIKGNGCRKCFAISSKLFRIVVYFAVMNGRHENGAPAIIDSAAQL